MAHETTFKNGTSITNYLAVAYTEGFEEPEYKEDEIRAWSYMIGTKLYTNLQGWFGRIARQIINEGYISEDGTVDWDCINEIMNTPD